MSFPVDKDNLRNTMVSSEKLSIYHTSDHVNLANAVNALETKVGVDSSLDTNSQDYKITQRVIKTGDTMTGNLVMSGASIVGADRYTFNLSYTPNGEAVGTMYWNSVDGTVDIRLLNNATLQVGQELHFYGKADGAISNGDVVMFGGVQGDHILLKKATTAVFTKPGLILGVATQNIANGNFGYVTWFGNVNDVYTTGWTAGDYLYLDATTAQLTNVVPTKPTPRIVMGGVVRLATGASENGKIVIKPVFYFNLGELNDVSITNAQPNDALVFDTNVWQNLPFNTMGTQTHSAGWLDRTITPTITVSSGNLTYTLTGTSTYYVNGTKYTSVNFTSGSRAMTKGNRYFFYIDPTNNQQWVTSPWDIGALAAPTLFTYYYDDTHYLPIEERHSSRRNPHAHKEFHFQNGCYWTSQDGLGMTGYTPDSTTIASWKWALESGTVRDEDLATVISAWSAGSYNNMYRELTTGYWYWDIGATIPFKLGANGRVAYNNPTGWVQTEASVGQCVNYYVCAFPSINAGTQIMSIQGQSIYANENSAVNATIANDITWGTLPSEEIKPLYQVTIQASGSGDKNFIANVKDIRASNQAITIGSSAVTSSHNSLSGLQGGTAGEYYHLTLSQYTVLSNQKALKYNWFIG